MVRVANELLPANRRGRLAATHFRAIDDGVLHTARAPRSTQLP